MSILIPFIYSMSQVYARQAQMQAESLESTNGNKESDSDSEAGPKPPKAYLQEGNFL